MNDKDRKIPTIESLISLVKSYAPTSDIAMIERAYLIASEGHSAQVRASGEPYIIHPLSVAEILTELHLDDVTIAAALMHDVVEDTLFTLEQIRDIFGDEMALLIDGVTKISLLTIQGETKQRGKKDVERARLKEEQQLETYRKMIIAMAKDIRVIMIKLADRLHNMRTLKYMRADKQKRIAKETLEIYAPIANRLGISNIKWELEDLSLRYLEPEIYYDLAGIKDPDKAIATIGKTALLEFKDEDGNTLLTGSDLIDAQPALNQQNNQSVVNLEFSTEGAHKFADATLNNVGRSISILLDGELLTNPVVREPIMGGRAEISGQRNLEEAQRLAILLRSGALPVKVNIIETRTVGPSLGLDSKLKSETAFIIGIAAVLIFMLLFYRACGFIANISLLAYTMLLLAILKALDATLTLPGISGIILSIGMAVDANVLIFEHFKEEFQLGKSIRLAMDSGFKRAFTTIFDSNTTTIIAAAVLFLFGSGNVRGFAITLGIGVALSMFTALTLTHYLLKLLINSRLSDSPAFFAANGFTIFKAVNHNA